MSDDDLLGDEPGDGRRNLPRASDGPGEGGPRPGATGNDGVPAGDDDSLAGDGAPDGDSAPADDGGAPDGDEGDGRQDALAVVDHAFFQLRRIWAKPHLAKQLSEQEGGKRVHLSNLMVINALAHLRSETSGEVSVGAVAERLDVDPSTASRLVALAIEAGFVARWVSPADARRAHLELTDAGERVAAVARQFRRRYYERLMADWEPAERAEFARLLRRFTDAAVAYPVSASRAAEIFAAARDAGRARPDRPADSADSTGSTDADTAPP